MLDTTATHDSTEARSRSRLRGNKTPHVFVQGLIVGNAIEELRKEALYKEIDESTLKRDIFELFIERFAAEFRTRCCNGNGGFAPDFLTAMNEMDENTFIDHLLLAIGVEGGMRGFLELARARLGNAASEISNDISTLVKEPLKNYL